MTLYLLKEIDDLTCEGEEYPREIINGWILLGYAIDLWKIVGSPKGEMLDQMLTSIQTPNEYGLRIISLPMAQHMLDMFNEFTQDLHPLVDDQWHIYPQYVDILLEKVPQCVDIWPTKNQTIYSLINGWSRIMAVRTFFRGALCFQSEVQLGWHHRTGYRSMDDQQEPPPKFRFNPDLPNIEAAIEDASSVPFERREHSRIYQRARVELRKELALNLAVRDETISQFPSSQGYGLLVDVVLEKEYASQEAGLRDNPPDQVSPNLLRVTADGTAFFYLQKISLLVRNVQTNQVMLLGLVRSNYGDHWEDAQKQFNLVEQIFSTRDEHGDPVQDGHRVRAFMVSKFGRETIYQDVTKLIGSAHIAQAQRFTYGFANQTVDRKFAYTLQEADDLISEATE